MRKVLAVLLMTSILGLNLGFNPDSFKLPADAKVLIVVEGLENSKCKVYAFEKTSDKWEGIFAVDGVMGRNGMNNYRKEGDGTTPIGVWQMDTPFGQKDAQEGFPANYIKVDETYVWTDTTNRLVKDETQALTGERVGKSNYAGYYDYVINAGYNKNAYPKKGNALFLHCLGTYTNGSSGCVQIPTDKMIEVMKLYGKYGDGKCYIAQAPKGKIDKLYDAYGVCNGLSPNGDFGIK